MAMLHQITHDKVLIKKKVNFFADFFNFAVEQSGLYDGIEIENYLSLVEKMIFQVTSNLNHCPQYVDSYLTHPLFNEHRKYFREYRSSKNLSRQFSSYNRLKKSSEKILWIKKHPAFLNNLLSFKKEVKQKMFKKALKNIISFLKCNHEIEFHKDELILFSNILVSEFILNEHSKNDIVEIFDKILTREPQKFPFPKIFLKKIKAENPEQEKIKFIQNRTFDQQFEGIYNVFDTKEKKDYFIFRIFGISSKDDFSTRYNQVTFYNPRHSKLRLLFDNVKTRGLFITDFFTEEKMLVAVVPIKYYSTDIAAQNAIEAIKRELPFLNKTCQSNGYLDPFSYMFTRNFNNYGGKWRGRNRVHIITDHESDLLKDSPFRRMKRRNKECSKHFLKYEHLFLEAINSNNIDSYWKYLETLLPKKSDGNAQVIEIVSSLLMLDSIDERKAIIRNYIESLISMFDFDPELIGISRQQQKVYYEQQRTRHGIDLNQLEREIKHQFINHLFILLNAPLEKKYHLQCKKYYSRVLWETKAQRNTLLHEASSNDKALITLFKTLPHLIGRFRRIIFDGWKSKNVKSFAELIELLKADAQALLI